MNLVKADLARTAPSAGAESEAASAVTAFSADLFAAAAGPADGNLVCSPYSVAVALGMAAQGATGSTATQIVEVLHSPDAARLAEGLNALDLALASRSGAVAEFGSALPGHTPRHIELCTANSLWGAPGVTWRRPFLDVLGTHFGTGMHVVDYRQAEAARASINAWVSQETRARIPDLIPAGVLNRDTRLTLVNALYLKAPWDVQFRPELTRPAPFLRLDGTAVEARLMTGAGSGFSRGPDWVAADLAFAGGQLAMAVVVPDEGRFAGVEKSLAGNGLARLLAGFEPAPVHVELPRWTARTPILLGHVLSSLGMPLALTDDADFSLMTSDEPITISEVVHESFIAVDETGIEAAAATALMARAGGRFSEPPSVIADRPFVYVVHDRPTGVPLFVGRVLDPTSS